jgi:hypothetical protein
MFRTVLGIDSAAPGFRRVRIEPHLGMLQEASGSIPHPKGEVSVAYRVNGPGIEAEVELPAGVTGEFVWHGIPSPLKNGRQTVRLKAVK